jgi:sucrose phosphorylase
MAGFGEDLAFVYGESAAAETLPRLEALLEAYADRLTTPTSRYRWSERDAVLITYADNLRRPGERPLQTLTALLGAVTGDAVNAVHLLPFFPSTSDDGFSVADYLAVDPACGTWADVERLAGRTRLMFDAVVNHMSASHAWFQGFLAGDPRYASYAITESPETDLSQVVRPRTSPLLTRFETARGGEHVWTTFSADQIDLNYANPAVLLDMIRVLLEYVHRGADILRLDAVTYLWKQAGTTSVHLPETHRVIQLIRRVLDALAPQVTIITETNVPHDENVSYFGDGHNEAQLVYNFALPPLVLHSFVSGDATALSTWAATLASPSSDTCFFNFLASHDGIGVRGAEAMLSVPEVQALAARAEAHGGLVGYRSLTDGTAVPYELNVNYFDALSDPASTESVTVQVARFLTAQAIMLAVPGVPGIYLHSLVGSRGWPEGVALTGHNRTTNREKLDGDRLLDELADPGHRRSLVNTGYRSLLDARRVRAAFDPAAPARVVTVDPRLFVIERGSGSDAVVCVHNVTGEAVPYDLEGYGIIAAVDADPSGSPVGERYEEIVPPWSTRWLMQVP